MTNPILLNSKDHKYIRVISTHSEDYGDNVNAALVAPTEFAEVQREYPILIARDEKGAYRPVAILGFEKSENLFLGPDGWNARYIPAIQQRGPFLIGHDRNGGEGSQMTVMIDVDDPRVSKTEGQPLFKEEGGNAPYLDYILRVLKILNEGVKHTPPMMEAFQKYDLIEGVNLEITVDEDHVYKLPNFYTISTEKFMALEGEALEDLHKSGYLQAATYILASNSNFQNLIRLKNQRD